MAEENKSQEYTDARKKLVELQSEYKKLVALERKGVDVAKEKAKVYQDIQATQKGINQDAKINKDLTKEIENTVAKTKARFEEVLSVSYKIGTSDRERVKRALSNSKAMKDSAKLAQIQVDAQKEGTVYEKTSENFKSNISDLAKNINDIAIDNINNARNMGTAEFKQIDIAKQKEKLEQLKNSRLAEGVNYRTKEGREIGKAIKEIEEQISKQDEINQGLEKSNDLAKQANDSFNKGLDSFIGKVDALPGGAFLRERLGFGDSQLKVIKDGFGKGIANFAKGVINAESPGENLKKSFGVMKDTLAKAGISMKALVSAAAVLGGAIIFGAVLTKFSATLDSIGEQFGSLKVLGSDFRNTLLDSNVEAIKVGGNLQDVSNITIALASNFGTNVDAAAELSGKVFDTSKAIGLSADEGANLFGVLMQTSNLSADQAEKLAEGTFQLARQAGVAPTAVLKDIAGSAETIALFTKDGGDNIAEAAVQARKLGVGLETTAKIAEGLLDFESSISKEVEASVLIGRQLNLQKAREAALNNDIAGAMEEVVKQVGSEEEFNKLNLIQRKALADSIGVSVAEMSKLVGQSDKLSLSGALAAGNFEDLLGEEGISNLTKLTKSFAALGASLTNSLGPILNVVASGLNLVLSPLVGMISAIDKLVGLGPALIAVLVMIKGKAMATAVASALSAVAGFFKGASLMSIATGGFGTPLAIGMAIAAAGALYKAMSSVPTAQTGRNMHSGGPVQALESGPEIFNVPAGTSIMGAEQTRQALNGGGTTSPTQEVKVVLPEAVPITIEGDTLRGFLQLETVQPLAGGDASFDNVG